MSSFYPAISRSRLASLYVQLRTIVGSSLFLSIVIALIALTHTALSQIPIPTPSPQTQDWSKLPELPLWYEEVNGLGGEMTYLPDFDTENGGKNALYFSTTRVIYNRFKGDTSTMFAFPEGGSKIIRGDFNGDGITDYFSNRLYLYQSTKNGVPPKNIALYYRDSESSNDGFTTTTDFNQDGKDDIIYATYAEPDTLNQQRGIGRIIIGGDDLTQLEIVKLPFTENVTQNMWNDTEKQCLIDAYYLDGKGLRVITMTHLQNPKTFKLSNPQVNLWALEITGTRNNRKVQYTLLHSLKVPETSGYPDVLPYNYQGYHNRTGIHAFSLYPNTYSLHTDKILFALDNPLFGAGGWSLGIASIRPDKPFTWIAQAVIFDGDPRTSNIPFAKIIFGFTKGAQDDLIGYRLVDRTVIGDVNNDGLNDVAAIYGATGGVNSRIFRIYLGIDGSTSTVSNTNSESPSISFPQPIPSSKPTIIKVSTAEQIRATLTLYSQRGEIATQLWSGELLQGENSIPFDAQRLGLSRGWYNLRLQLGSKVIDKALIIE